MNKAPFQALSGQKTGRNVSEEQEVLEQRRPIGQRRSGGCASRVNFLSFIQPSASGTTLSFASCYIKAMNRRFRYTGRRIGVSSSPWSERAEQVSGEQERGRANATLEDNETSAFTLTSQVHRVDKPNC